MEPFEQSKQDILSRKDNSAIGTIDEKIIKLCKKINSLENYYTTSSCSGRVLLIVDKDQKAGGLMLKTWHDEIFFSELKRELQKIKAKEIRFKQEPCILHVACRDLKTASEILKKAQAVGWKRSGIISIERKFVVELMATEKLEFPIIHDGKILVENNFLKIIVKKSNENLKKSWMKIEKLRKLI